MSDLPRGISEFLGRDIFYAIGGGAVLTSFLYRFDHLPTKDTAYAYYIFGLGVSYVLGQAIAGVTQATRLVTTDWVEKPWPWMIYLYEQYDRGKWRPFENGLDRNALRKAMQRRFDAGPGYLRDFWERRSRSLIMWAVIAPCCFLSAWLLLWRASVSHLEFDYVVAAGALLLSIAAHLMNWLCAIHCTQLDRQALVE